MFTEIENPQGNRAAEITQFTITSNYKGVMLAQPVKVLRIMPERVIFKAPEPTVCFTLKERVHLYSRVSWETFDATLLAIDMLRGEMELANLTFTGGHWNERQSDRVEPRDPIYVNLDINKSRFQADLENLSVGGMSLMICNYKEKAIHIDHDSAVRLTLQLPGDDTGFELRGKVVHSRQVGRLVIIGIQLIASRTQEKRIYGYVTARKAEIMAELEGSLQEFFKQRWIASYYY